MTSPRLELLHAFADLVEGDVGDVGLELALADEFEHRRAVLLTAGLGPDEGDSGERQALEVQSALRLSTHLARHVQALPHISRCHIYRIGGGGAHLHVWFFARPEGQTQLFGPWLVVWDDLLPEYPSAVAETDSARSH